MITVFKQSFFILGAKVAAGLIGFFVFTTLANHLDVFTLGEYVYYLGVASILAAITGFGMNEYFYRKTSSTPEYIFSSLKKIGQIRFLLSLLGAGAFSFIHVIRGGTLSSFIIFAILFSALVIESQSAAIINALRSLSYSKVELYFVTLKSANRFLAAYSLLVYLKVGLVPFLMSVLGINLAAMLVALFVLSRLYNGSRTELTATHWVILRESGPYFLMAIFGNIYLQISPVLLGYVSNKSEVGIFGVGFQILQFAYFAPVALYIALQPPLSRVFESDFTTWAQNVRKLFLLTTGLSGIASAILFYLSPWIIRLFFSDQYLSAIEVSQVLMLAFFFLSIWSVFFLTVLISAKRMKALNSFYLFKLLLLSAFGWMLGREGGATGMAQAFLLSEAIGIGAALFWMLPGFMKKGGQTRWAV